MQEQPRTREVALPDGDPDRTTALGWHAVLLRMGGAVPDDLLTEARAWLAEGQYVDVAQALTFALVAGRIPLSRTDAAFIAGELSRAQQDTDGVGQIELLEDDEILPSPWSFAPVRIEEGEDATGSPALLDLSENPALLDPIDAAAVAAASGEQAVTALWRAWRSPVDGSPWPRPRRVFVLTVVGTDRDVDLPALTSRVQEAVAAAGERDPQIEVFGDQSPVPGYHSSACARAALLWAHEPPAPIRLARVFDRVDPEQGPMFDDGHRLIEDGDHVQRLLDYLDGALPVLTTTSMMADVLDPGRPAVVPLTFRTDGQWIWTDTIGFYLERYALAPEHDLLLHLDAAPEVPSPVSEVALHRVLSFLLRSPEAGPAWLVPQTVGSESRPATL